MSQLENYEKVERVLFQGGSFSIKNTVLLGSKSATGTRLNPVYKRTYNSTKYTDRSQLSTMSVRTSDYIVFSYTNFDNVSKENKGMEIYSSYPHMLDVISFFEECDGLLNTQGVFTKNGISKEYSEVLLESEELAGGKRLRAIPHLIEIENGLKQGIMLFLNDEDKYVELDAKAVSTILYMIGKVDLLTLSNQTIAIGMIYDAGGMSAGSESNTSFESSGRTGAFANKNRRSTFAGRTGNSRFTPQPQNTSNDDGESVDQADGNEEFEEGEEQVFQPPKRQTANNNKTGKKGFSMSDIKNKADEIDVSDVEEIDV